MNKTFEKAVSYSAATGLLLAMMQDYLLHDDPLSKEKSARIIINAVDDAGDMPDSVVKFRNDLKAKYNL